MRAALYARVSTHGQNIESQLEGLREQAKNREIEIYKEYVDHGYSGADDQRPELERLMYDARLGRFKVVLVTALDRFGRSMRFLVNTLEELRLLKIELISCRHAIDTRTPGGKAMYGMISVMAEFEKDLISERVKVGMARAKEKGKKLGRPRLSQKIAQEVLKLKAEGLSYTKIAERVGRTRGSVVGICFRASQKGAQNAAPEPAENKDSGSDK